VGSVFWIEAWSACTVEGAAEMMEQGQRHAAPRRAMASQALQRASHPAAGHGRQASWPRIPPPERWYDWTVLDAKAWPKRVECHYTILPILPTVCFNCEAACGLVAYEHCYVVAGQSVPISE
jgi:anaerobic selenocysteine-containing dehydrogenase